MRARPPLFRALGSQDPPTQIEVSGTCYERIDIFKHDSWAATARYRGPNDDIVCKFNRVQSILGMPMRWLGRWLARRESRALKSLANVNGIPAEKGRVSVQGKRLINAVAHVYIPGRPFAVDEQPNDAFFLRLLTLLDHVHDRDMAYVDLHKRENILVDDEGKPWLIDFQVCYALGKSWLSNNAVTRWVLRALQKTDLYHVAKHVTRHRPDQLQGLNLADDENRPWWISAHRTVAVPLRQLRRKLLTILGVRGKSGSATSEAFPEDAVRRELDRAA